MALYFRTVLVESGTIQLLLMSDATGTTLIPGFLKYWPVTPGLDVSGLAGNLDTLLFVFENDEIANNVPALLFHPRIFVHGKECCQRRSVGFFGPANVAGYTYSRQTAPRQELVPWMVDLIKLVNGAVGANFNSILINHYENGEEYISQHSDSEKGLVPGSKVATISIGAERTFIIKRKGGPTVLKQKLKSGSIAVMEDQSRYTHGINKEKKIRGERFSVTFREHASV